MEKLKTNQILIRPMGEFEVEQRTSDAMFNATAILKMWNQYVDKHSIILNTQNSGYLKRKDLDDFFNNKSTKDFIEVIQKKENSESEKSVYKKTRGRNGGTWMHPFLFMDFVMWLNPEFKYEVIKFVYDQLIQLRNEAGSSYKEMCIQVAKLVDKEFQQGAIQAVARANNYIVYNNHVRDIRNKRAEEQYMQELIRLQIKVKELIEDGFIVTFQDLMKHLKLMWRKKYEPKTLAI